MSIDKQDQQAKKKRWYQSVLFKICTVLLGSLFITLGISSVVFGWWGNRIGPNDKNTIITISEETTYFTEPLNELGFVDYAAAINGKLGAGVTPETNFAVAFLQAVGPDVGDESFHLAYAQALGIEPLPAEGDYFIPFDEHLKKLLLDSTEAVDVGIARQEEMLQRYNDATNNPWQAEDFPEFASWLEANRIPLEKIEQGVKRPHYYRPIVITDEQKGDASSSALLNAILPDVQLQRELARALSIRAMQAIAAGELEAAQRDLWTIHQMAEHVRHGSTLIESLVAMAIDGIACRGVPHLITHPNFTAEQARNFREQLLSAGPLMTASQLGNIINQGERTFGLDAVQSVARGLVDKQELGGQLGIPGFANPNWNKTLLVLNGHYDQIYAASQLGTHAEREQATTDWTFKLKNQKQASTTNILKMAFASAETRGEMMGNLFAALLVPGAENSFHSADRTEMRWRLTITALAIVEFLKTEDQLPATLDELSPAYLAEIPADLFSEAPLIYQPDGEKQEFLLYSVGPNLIDDKGFEREESDERPDADDVAIRFLQK